MEDIIHKSIRHKVRDANFNIESLSRYLLVIKLADNGVVISVFDPVDNRILVVERYSYIEANNDNAMIVRLHNIWSTHDFLNAGFWNNVQIISGDLNFTFVPEDLYREENAEEFLKINCHANIQSQSVFSDYLTPIRSHCLFLFSKQLLGWFEELYPNATLKLVHLNHSFLQGALDMMGDGGESHEGHGQEKGNQQLLVNFSCNLLTVASIRDNSLAFINTYKVKGAADMVYYILMVAEELNIPFDKLDLEIWGDLDESSGFEKIIGNYIQSLNFGARPAFLNFSWHFDVFGSVKNMP